MEVLLGLPMEPYRFPEVDPGPGALLMSMPPGEIQQLVGSHLEAVAPAVGVVNRMGSRLTEDRPRMRAVLEVLAARRLFLVDAYTSSQSVAFDEARDAGVRAARRQILVDHARGEAGDRARWDEVAGWAERRGEVDRGGPRPSADRAAPEGIRAQVGSARAPAGAGLPTRAIIEADMIVLGIETSCDETAAAVLDGGRKILSSVVASQDDVHAPYGGVVPELASRRHLEVIVPVVRRALETGRRSGSATSTASP